MDKSEQILRVLMYTEHFNPVMNQDHLCEYDSKFLSACILLSLELRTFIGRKEFINKVESLCKKAKNNERSDMEAIEELLKVCDSARGGEIK